MCSKLRSSLFGIDCELEWRAWTGTPEQLRKHVNMLFSWIQRTRRPNVTWSTPQMWSTRETWPTSEAWSTPKTWSIPGDAIHAWNRDPCQETWSMPAFGRTLRKNTLMIQNNSYWGVQITSYLRQLRPTHRERSTFLSLWAFLCELLEVTDNLSVRRTLFFWSVYLV